MIKRGKAVQVVVTRKGECMYFPSLHQCSKAMGVTMTRVRRAIHSADGRLFVGRKVYHIDEALPVVVKELLEEKGLLSSIEEIKGIKE